MICNRNCRNRSIIFIGGDDVYRSVYQIRLPAHHSVCLNDRRASNTKHDLYKLNAPTLSCALNSQAVCLGRPTLYQVVCGLRQESYTGELKIKFLIMTWCFIQGMYRMSQNSFPSRAVFFFKMF